MEDYVKRYVQKSLHLGPTITSFRITQPEQKPATNTYRNANRRLSFERTSYQTVADKVLSVTDGKRHLKWPHIFFVTEALAALRFRHLG